MGAGKSYLFAALLAVKMILAILIALHFWTISDAQELRSIPFYLIICCIMYIIAQLLSYYLSKEQNWWDWVYYIGLLCIMITVSFASNSNYTYFNLIVKTGTILLFVPIFIDLYYLSKKIKK